MQRTFGLWHEDLVGRRLDRDLARGGPRAHRRVPRRGHGDAGRLDRTGRAVRRHQEQALHRGMRRQQPAGRPGGEGTRAQPARRDRAQGARGPAAPARLPRPADTARQPQPVPQPRRARDRALAAHAGPPGGPDDRPRQLQERERHARPRRRRPAAADGRAAARQVHAGGRHGRPARRRRVRGAARGRHDARAGRADRGRGDRRVPSAALDRRQRAAA